MATRDVAPALIAGACLVLATQGAAADSPEAPAFIELGSMPGLSWSRALDLTPDGKVVVGLAESEDGPQAFRWSFEDGMEGLGDLPGGDYYSVATAVSTSGDVVVGWSASDLGEQEAFRWTPGQGMQRLGDLPGGAFLSKATGVSSNGAVVVGWGTPADGQLEAFRWTALGGLVGLGDLPGGIMASRAMSVSGGGSVVCGWGSSGVGVNEAFLWTAATGMVGLGFLPNAFLDGTQTFDVSFDGSVLVGSGWAELGVQPLRWTAADGMIALGDLPGGGAQPFGFAFAVSADGTTIVGAGTTDVGLEAFVHTDASGLRNLRTVLENDYDLDLSGWILSEARGVSAFGNAITGWGYHDGVEEGWLALLPDEEPSCIGDLNGDGAVNVADMLVMMNLFGACDDCDDCPADLNGDCTVNMADVTVLFDHWGACP